jgi:hypothetical protein
VRFSQRGSGTRDHIFVLSKTRVLQLDLFFSKMRGLIATCHSPSTGGESWWEVALQCGRNLLTFGVTERLHFLGKRVIKENGVSQLVGAVCSF